MLHISHTVDSIKRTPRHRVVAAAVVLAAITIGLAGPVGGIGSGSDARLKSVQFDLVDSGDSGDAGGAEGPLGAQGATQTAEYRSLTVGVDGADVALRPLDGSVRIAVNEYQLANMAAEKNGQQIGHAADGFANLLADVVSSPSAHSFLRLGSRDASQTSMFDLSYDRPLGTADYLLVQEGGGDATIEIVSIDSAGAAVGPARQVGPGYQWNTGHGPISQPTAWASVIPVASLSENGQAVAAIRVSSTDAQVKVIALTSQATASPVPATLAATEVATITPVGSLTQVAEAPIGGLPPQVASVGLETKIHAAISVGGTSCMDGPATDPATLKTGEAATFCFVVTNRGSTNLANVAITDELLGLAGAVLPKAAGPDVLKPGEQAAYYYHTVLAARPANAASSVTASVIDDNGAPLPAELVEYVVEPVSAPAVTVPASAPQPTPASTATEAAAPAVTQLAMTGFPTDPWALVIFAMGLIFFGYTAYAAFQNRSTDNEPAGHEQLDALGFD